MRDIKPSRHLSQPVPRRHPLTPLNFQGSAPLSGIFYHQFGTGIAVSRSLLKSAQGGTSLEHFNLTGLTINLEGLHHLSRVNGRLASRGKDHIRLVGGEPFNSAFSATQPEAHFIDELLDVLGNFLLTQGCCQNRHGLDPVADGTHLLPVSRLSGGIQSDSLGEIIAGDHALIVHDLPGQRARIGFPSRKFVIWISLHFRLNLLLQIPCPFT